MTLQIRFDEDEDEVEVAPQLTDSQLEYMSDWVDAFRAHGYVVQWSVGDEVADVKGLGLQGSFSYPGAKRAVQAGALVANSQFVQPAWYQMATRIKLENPNDPRTWVKLLATALYMRANAALAAVACGPTNTPFRWEV